MRVVDYSQTKDKGFITSDGRTTFGIIYEPQPNGFVDPNQKPIEDTFNAQLKQHGFTGGLTGYAQLASGGGDNGGPSVLDETLLGALGALAVLLFVFASFLALVPLLIAAVSILTTFLIVLLLTFFTDVSFVVQFLIALVGLGVAIDYSLLAGLPLARGARARARQRGGRAHRRCGPPATPCSPRASRSRSACSPWSSSRCRCCAAWASAACSSRWSASPSCSPCCPACSPSIGPRVDFPHIRKEGTASRGWTAWARLIVRRRGSLGGAALIVLALLIAPVSAHQDRAVQHRLAGRRRPGVRDAADPDRRRRRHRRRSPRSRCWPTTRTTPRPSRRPRGKVDGDPPGRGLRGRAPTGARRSTSSRTTRPSNSSSVEVVDAVTAADRGRCRATSGPPVSGATIVDYLHAVYDKFPYVLALIALITFLLLVRTFRSLLLPLKAVVLNLVSLAAVFGAGVPVLAGGPRLRGGLRRRGHRRDHLLAAACDLRVPVRPVDGLRGLHPGPDARGVRPQRLHPGGGRHAASAAPGGWSPRRR